MGVQNMFRACFIEPFASLYIETGSVINKNDTRDNNYQ